MRSDVAYTFGPYRLDVRVLRLTRDGVLVVVPLKLLELLHALVAKAGQVVTKDDLIRVAWQSQPATDNALAQAMLQLRTTLDADGPSAYVETVRGYGYRFVAQVEVIESRPPAAVDHAALMARHRAWFDGRALLESMVLAQVVEARVVFERLLRDGGEDDVRLHIGLANACAIMFEGSRASASPDFGARRIAYEHAVIATELAPDRGEAWATLGFVLGLMRRQAESLGAIDRAMRLDPKNWRISLRLALSTWGTQRLESIAHLLTLMPQLPMANWLVAAVHVARNARKEAARELDLALAIVSRDAFLSPRFQAVGLYWLRGFLLLAEGQVEAALQMFRRELHHEAAGHIYASECCAQGWYGIGCCYIDSDEALAREALGEALKRVPGHPMSHLGLSMLDARRDGGLVAVFLDARLLAVVASRPVDPHAADLQVPAYLPFEVHMARAGALKADGDKVGCMRMLEAALAAERPGSSGWQIPLDPLLCVQDDPELSVVLLGRLSDRAW